MTGNFTDRENLLPTIAFPLLLFHSSWTPFFMQGNAYKLPQGFYVEHRVTYVCFLLFVGYSVVLYCILARRVFVLGLCV